MLFSVLCLRLIGRVLFASVMYVDDCVGKFYDFYLLLLSVIPVSYVRLTRTTKPWIIPVVIHLINKRWHAFRSKNFALYNHYKITTKSEITKSKMLWSKKCCLLQKMFGLLKQEVC